MRKIFIGFISLAAVVGAFLLYSSVDKTPPIDIGAGAGVTGVADSNFGDFGDVNERGKIGDVEVGTSEKAYYATLNDDGEIIEEFGFEVLLHKEGDVWELKKPYWNIYKPDFTCKMTADMGSVEMENAAGGTTPKDATFSDNVVIHILPGKSGELNKTTIYLDDLIFLSDRSQLVTDGPVKVDSEALKMVGTGMEVVYNEMLGRLEFFRVYDLESLIFKVPRSDLKEKDQTVLASEIKSESTTQQPVDTTAVVDTQMPAEQQEDQYYKCLFSRNVLVDTPDELIFAAREVLINDIFGENDPGKDDVSVKSISGSDANEPVPGVVDSNEPNIPVFAVAEPNEPNMPVFAVAEPNDPNESSVQLVEVTVVCDNGFAIAPRDSVIELEESAQTAPEAEKNVLAYDLHEKAAGRTILVTQRIDYSALMEDAFTTGPTELIFYAEDSNSTDPNQNIIPVKVTAQKQARFLKKENQVIFDGDCFCTMPQMDLTIEKDLTLSAPRIIVDLPDSNSQQTSTLPDMTTIGLTELVFYYEDPNAVDPNQTLLPVKITAQKQARLLSASNQVVFEGDCFCQMGSESINKGQTVELRSPMLTVDLSKEKSDKPFAITDFVAAGPVELDFFVDDMTGSQGPNEPLPAKVIAQKQARFLSSSMQVVFEGSSRTTITKEDPNFVEEFTLLSELMTVDLPKDSNDRSSASLGGIKHLTAEAAEGGVVRLSAIKRAKEEMIQTPDHESETMLSEIEIKCSQIDYDAENELFVATGPALVKLTNTEVKDPNEEGAKLGLGKKWWAVVENCHNIQYSPKENRIIANAMPGETLNIQYITLEDGQYGPVVLAAAGHSDIKLIETADGQTDLSTLFASGGIDYNDVDNRFFGSELLYVQETSLITVTGDDTQPCWYNGSLVDRIKYNLKTGEIEAEIVGPGTMQLKK